MADIDNSASSSICDNRDDRRDDYRRRDRSRSRDRQHGKSKSRRRSRERRNSGSRHSRSRRSRSRSKSYSRSPEPDREERSRHRRRSRSRSRSHERPRSTSDIRGAQGERDLTNFNDDDDDSRKHTRDDVHRERHREKDWRMKLTSIRDAHFNRSKQAPAAAQNQFRNDGSFMEMFKQKMAAQNADDQSPAVTPNSLVLASSSIKYNDISLPPLTAPLDSTRKSASTSVDQDLDGVPIRKPLPVPVAVVKRRNAKPLKTGIVYKKPQEPDEDEASQEKLDAWSRYLQEVQKYKKDNCMEEDSSRPLVK